MALSLELFHLLLRAAAESCRPRCRSWVSGGEARRVGEQLPTVKQPADPSLPPEVTLDGAAQQSVCAVVNTCEYCSETTGQVGANLRSPFHYLW